jgi:hypothetical protein
MYRSKISDLCIRALFEAVKSYEGDYWIASKVINEYARAGGREF